MGMIRQFKARYGGRCSKCSSIVEIGEDVVFLDGWITHLRCSKGEEPEN